jgi:hypothetical protein
MVGKSNEQKGRHRQHSMYSLSIEDNILIAWEQEVT